MSSMPRLFLTNFEFEDELAGRPTNQDKLIELRRSLANVWLAFAKPGDCIYDADESILLPQTDKTPFPKIDTITEQQLAGRHGCFELIPWGWSDACLQFAGRFGLETNAPNVADVRTINDRQFGFDFETEQSIGLDGMVAIKTPDEFVEQVMQLVRGRGQDADRTRWILKPRLSASGRHCLRGQGRPTQPQLAWVEKRTGGQAVLFLEPQVERVREAGFQFWLDDQVRFDGCVEMITDPNGQFRGSIACPTIDPVWSTALPWCTRMAEQIRRIGYFGPLGIDSMLYRHHDGQIRQRPVQDVNGRFTMGRAAWNLQRFVDCDETILWLHCDPNQPETTLNQLATHFPFAKNIITTSNATNTTRTSKLPVLVVVPADVETVELLSITRSLFAR
jgi:hypothetical protein